MRWLLLLLFSLLGAIHVSAASKPHGFPNLVARSDPDGTVNTAEDTPLSPAGTSEQIKTPKEKKPFNLNDALRSKKTKDRKKNLPDAVVYVNHGENDRDDGAIKVITVRFFTSLVIYLLRSSIGSSRST
jgi:hypothetical protein